MAVMLLGGRKVSEAEQTKGVSPSVTTQVAGLSNNCHATSGISQLKLNRQKFTASKKIKKSASNQSGVWTPADQQRLNNLDMLISHPASYGVKSKLLEEKHILLLKQSTYRSLCIKHLEQQKQSSEKYTQRQATGFKTGKYCDLKPQLTILYTNPVLREIKAKIDTLNPMVPEEKEQIQNFKRQLYVKSRKLSCTIPKWLILTLILCLLVPTRGAISPKECFIKSHPDKGGNTTAFQYWHKNYKKMGQVELDDCSIPEGQDESEKSGDWTQWDWSGTPGGKFRRTWDTTDDHDQQARNVSPYLITIALSILCVIFGQIRRQLQSYLESTLLDSSIWEVTLFLVSENIIGFLLGFTGHGQDIILIVIVWYQAHIYLSVLSQYTKIPWLQKLVGIMRLLNTIGLFTACVLRAGKLEIYENKPGKFEIVGKNYCGVPILLCALHKLTNRGKFFFSNLLIQAQLLEDNDVFLGYVEGLLMLLKSYIQSQECADEANGLNDQFARVAFQSTETGQGFISRLIDELLAEQGIAEQDMLVLTQVANINYVINKGSDRNKANSRWTAKFTHKKKSKMGHLILQFDPKLMHGYTVNGTKFKTLDQQWKAMNISDIGSVFINSSQQKWVDFKNYMVPTWLNDVGLGNGQFKVLLYLNGPQGYQVTWVPKNNPNLPQMLVNTAAFPQENVQPEVQKETPAEVEQYSFEWFERHQEWSIITSSMRDQLHGLECCVKQFTVEIYDTTGQQIQLTRQTHIPQNLLEKITTPECTLIKSEADRQEPIVNTYDRRLKKEIEMRILQNPSLIYTYHNSPTFLQNFVIHLQRNLPQIGMSYSEIQKKVVEVFKSQQSDFYNSYDQLHGEVYRKKAKDKYHIEVKGGETKSELYEMFAQYYKSIPGKEYMDLTDLQSISYLDFTSDYGQYLLHLKEIHGISSKQWNTQRQLLKNIKASQYIQYLRQKEETPDYINIIIRIVSYLVPYHYLLTMGLIAIGSYVTGQFYYAILVYLCLWSHSTKEVKGEDFWGYAKRKLNGEYSINIISLISAIFIMVPLFLNQYLTIASIFLFLSIQIIPLTFLSKYAGMYKYYKNVNPNFWRDHQKFKAWMVGKQPVRDKTPWNIIPIYPIQRYIRERYSAYTTDPELPDWFKNQRKLRAGNLDSVTEKFIGSILNSKAPKVKVDISPVEELDFKDMVVKNPRNPNNIIQNSGISTRCFDRWGKKIPLWQLLKDTYNELFTKNKKIQLPGLTTNEHDQARMNGKKYNENAVPKFARPGNFATLMGVLNRSFGHTAKHNPKFFSHFKQVTQPKVEEIIHKINSYTETHDTISLEQYISHFDRRKKTHYTRVLNQAKQAGYQINMTDKVTPNFKNDEACYAPDAKVRPRIIWNPDDYLKLFGGWFNYHIIQALRHHYPWFVQGYNTHELAEHMTENCALTEDYAWLAQDGSAHDSSQFAEYKEHVDKQIVDGICDKLMAKLNLPIGLSDQLKKLCGQQIFRYEMRYDGKRNGPIMMTGKIKGTVLSGHPTQTTTFNTVRVFLMIYYMCQEAQIPESAWKAFISGDDCLVRLQKIYLHKFVAQMKLIYTTSAYPQMHGMGYIVREFAIHDTNFTFLSKIGTITPQGIRMARQTQRLILGGNVSQNINESISLKDYNHGLCFQLKYQGSHNSLVKSYNEQRMIRHHIQLCQYSQQIAEDMEKLSYNNHHTSDDLNWWDNYQALTLDAGVYMDQYEPTNWMYSQLSSFEIDIHSKVFDEYLSQFKY